MLRIPPPFCCVNLLPVLAEACLAIIMAFSRTTARIFALENCEYERWRVPGPRVTAIPFANLSGAIVRMVESAPRALRPCMVAVS